MITNAFTCTGPYAILIMLGIKRVENRSMMPTPKAGRCAVSCSKSFCKEEFGAFIHWASRALPSECFRALPAWGDVEDWPGKVIGCCDYTATLDANGQEWNEGYPYWWMLSNVVCFARPIPCRGNVGMWPMPPSLSAAVTAADAANPTTGISIGFRRPKHILTAGA